MSPSHLETLPIELVNLIADSLDVADIGTLRLASRNLETKLSSYGRFAILFRQHNVRLETGILQKLAAASDQGHLICQLQDCTLMGVLGPEALHSSENMGENSAEAKQAEVTAEEEHTRLLTDAFCNIRRRFPGSSLAAVRLRVVIRNNDGTLTLAGDRKTNGIRSPFEYSLPRLRVWNMAQRVFRAVMAALEAARLPVDGELDIFRGQATCCLTSNLFLATIPSKTSSSPYPWTAIFGNLKTLRISMSSPRQAYSMVGHPSIYDPENEWTGRDGITMATRARPPGNLFTDLYRRMCTDLLFEGVLPLLAILPSLETIDLLGYHLDKEMAVPTLIPPATEAEAGELKEPAPQGDAVGDRQPRRLKDCRFAGLTLAKDDLLRFLQRTQPESLVLDHVRLSPGSYSDVFRYLTDPATPITSYRLHDLLEGDAEFPLHFDIPELHFYDFADEYYLPGWKGTVTPRTLTRQGFETKKAIIYYPQTDIVLSSLGSHIWIKNKMRLYWYA